MFLGVGQCSYHFHAFVVFPAARLLSGFETAELCDFLDFAVLSGLRAVASSESLVIVVLPGRRISSSECFLTVLPLAVASGSSTGNSCTINFPVWILTSSFLFALLSFLRSAVVLASAKKLCSFLPSVVSLDGAIPSFSPLKTIN